MPIVADPNTNPQGFARESIIAALLCLADPERKAEHEYAAWSVAEAVTLASIAAAKELVEQHRGRHHRTSSTPPASSTSSTPPAPAPAPKTQAGTLYSIGFVHVKKLSALVQTEAERDAVSRLDEGRGSEADLRKVVKIYERNGEDFYARELLRLAPRR